MANSIAAPLELKALNSCSHTIFGHIMHPLCPGQSDLRKTANLVVPLLVILGGIYYAWKYFNIKNDISAKETTPKKSSFIVDVLLMGSAKPYESEVMSIVSQIAGKNFGQKFDNTEPLGYLKDAKNSKRVLIIFVSTQSRHNLDFWNKDLSSFAEAVGHEGRVVFEVLKHNDPSITSESIKNMLFGKGVDFPISEEYQKRIEINTYLRTNGEEVSKQMGDDLKELLNRL